jgi:hypothetical protein
LGGNPGLLDVPLSHEDYPDDNQHQKNKEKNRPVEKCADNRKKEMQYAHYDVPPGDKYACRNDDS